MIMPKYLFFSLYFAHQFRVVFFRGKHPPHHNAALEM